MPYPPRASPLKRLKSSQSRPTHPTLPQCRTHAWKAFCAGIKKPGISPAFLTAYCLQQRQGVADDQAVFVLVVLVGHGAAQHGVTPGEAHTFEGGFLNGVAQTET